jgi:hypothetical protein
MSRLWNAIRDFFRDPPAPPRLRNRPDGMAWIKGIGTDFGADALNGRAVKTVTLNEAGAWVLDPPQVFHFTRDAVDRMTGEVYPKGQGMKVLGLEDEFLEPWRDVGDGDCTEELDFQPTVPARVPGRVSA